MPFKEGQGGRKPGAKNKATRDIRALLQDTVDWSLRIANLVKLADGGNVKAEEILWQYGFGKPVEIQIAPMQINHKTEEQTVKHEHALDMKSVNALTALANKLSKRES